MRRTTLISAFTLLWIATLSTTTFAQVTAVWQGDSPCRPTDWNWPANWDSGRVPNEFNDVLIPDLSTTNGVYPILDSEAEAIHSLTISSNARMTIAQSGTLKIIDQLNFIGNGQLNMKGLLNIEYDSDGLDVDIAEIDP